MGNTPSLPTPDHSMHTRRTHREMWRHRDVCKQWETAEQFHPHDVIRMRRAAQSRCDVLDLTALWHRNRQNSIQKNMIDCIVIPYLIWILETTASAIGDWRQQRLCQWWWRQHTFLFSHPSVFKSVWMGCDRFCARTRTRARTHPNEITTTTVYNIINTMEMVCCTSYIVSLVFFISFTGPCRVQNGSHYYYFSIVARQTIYDYEWHTDDDDDDTLDTVIREILFAA